MKGNITHENRTPRGQKNYEPWELKVMLAVNGKGITADDLMHVIKRTRASISRKSCEIGVSLKKL